MYRSASPLCYKVSGIDQDLSDSFNLSITSVTTKQHGDVLVLIFSDFLSYSHSLDFDGIHFVNVLWRKT